MIELKNTTFITALKVESADRYNNAKSVLGYLNAHFNANVIIYEMCRSQSNLDFLNDLENLNITLIEDDFSEIFHRTAFLNYMLRHVKTEVVCNYDIDVILPVDSYLACENEIISGRCDAIYPFPVGWAQKQVLQSFNREEFDKSFDIKLIDNSGQINDFSTNCGHAVFLNTKIYKEIGGENENFVSYGPEDVERLVRFLKFGMNVGRMDSGIVYHFEHNRGGDSGPSNPFFWKNNQELEKIKKMSAEEINKYLPPL